MQKKIFYALFFRVWKKVFVSFPPTSNVRALSTTAADSVSIFSAPNWAGMSVSLGGSGENMDRGFTLVVDSEATVVA